MLSILPGVMASLCTLESAVEFGPWSPCREYPPNMVPYPPLVWLAAIPPAECPVTVDPEPASTDPRPPCMCDMPPMPPPKAAGPIRVDMD